MHYIFVPANSTSIEMSEEDCFKTQEINLKQNVLVWVIYSKQD